VQRVLSHIRRHELLHAGERVGVAVSGGIDSVALLRLMLELRGELGIVLSVVHFNHKLRGAESDADEKFVADSARTHDLEFFCDSDDVAGHAAEERISLEAAARELRYGFFRFLIRGNPPAEGLVSTASKNRSAESAAPAGNSPSLNKILTGHTLDDQAETVLMRIIRGTGPRGLGGIHPRIAVEDDDGEICGEIVRPLLEIRRSDLEQYLEGIGQAWREDSSNAEDHLTRNRIRQLVVPLLEKGFNPSVAENLAELAEIARGEQDYWDNEIAGWMGTAVHWSEPEWARALSKQAELVQISPPNRGQQNPHFSQRQGEVGHPHGESDNAAARIGTTPWLVMNASVDRMWLLSEPLAVQRRLVKAVGEEAGIPLEFNHVEEILRFAAADARSGKELSLPGGWKLTHEPGQIVFVTPDLREEKPQADYEYELSIPGEVAVAEIGASFLARLVPPGAQAGYNPDHLLSADSLPRSLRVRNWRAGDRFWPAHSKSPKKVKELLQEQHIPRPTRKLWPVLANGDEIVWLRGFASPAKYLAQPGSEAVVILESALGDRRTT